MARTALQVMQTAWVEKADYDESAGNATGLGNGRLGSIGWQMVEKAKHDDAIDGGICDWYLECVCLHHQNATQIACSSLLEHGHGSIALHNLVVTFS